MTEDILRRRIHTVRVRRIDMIRQLCARLLCNVGIWGLMARSPTDSLRFRLGWYLYVRSLYLAAPPRGPYEP